MIALKLSKHLSKHLNKKVLINTIPIANRTYCDWMHRWKPGPYPETKEERDAAAAKYNLIPEDYEPMPRDSGMGDYPQIHMDAHNTDARPYMHDYDEPYFRRNFGEPLSEAFIAGQHNPPDNITGHKKEARLSLAIIVGLSCLLIFALVGPEKAILEIKPKPWPHQYFPGTRPKVHYTFEQND